jgi:hypothetical protein
LVSRSVTLEGSCGQLRFEPSGPICEFSSLSISPTKLGLYGADGVILRNEKGANARALISRIVAPACCSIQQQLKLSRAIYYFSSPSFCLIKLAQKCVASASSGQNASWNQRLRATADGLQTELSLRAKVSISDLKVEQKIETLREEDQPGVTISEVCRRHGLASVFCCRAACKSAPRRLL